MAKKTLQQYAVLGFYTETLLHCGAESAAGFVDLPVQRERHTNYPVIPGTTIKGVLRDDFVSANGQDRSALRNGFFGEEGATNAGSVAFGDGILVAFPVRSTGAPFHWVSCPLALERAFRNMGKSAPVPEDPGQGRAWATGAEREIALEELVVKTKAYPQQAGPQEQIAATLLELIPATDGFAYLRSVFAGRLLVLRDDDFQEIVETGTEVLTRIKLNSQGTTAKLSEEDRGNMFVEELVPSDTLFLAPLRGDRSFKDHLPPLIRLGGDETVGRGLTHVVIVDYPITPEGK